jgi:hypothetical protein
MTMRQTISPDGFAIIACRTIAIPGGVTTP